MTPHICEKVMDKIKEKNISPKSCWRFRAERCLVVILLVLFLVVGALALGVILELDDQLELENIITRPNGLALAFSSFPYFWLAIVTVFSALAVADFFRTRNGYKYRIKHVAIIFGGSMLTLGVIFYSSGLSQRVHAYLTRKINSYSAIVKNPHSFWSQPDDGLLSGVVVSNDPECHCMDVVDWGKNMWNVDYSRATIKSQVRLKSGEGVKIQGQIESTGKFRAEKISPWARGFLKMNGTSEEEDEIYKGIRNEMPAAVPPGPMMLMLEIGR